MCIEHAIVDSDGFVIVRLEKDCATPEIAAFMKEHSLQHAGTDDALSFRSIKTNVQDFSPLVAFGSSVRCGATECVVYLNRGGGPFEISLVPREGRLEFAGTTSSNYWKKGTHFLCKKE